MVRMSGAFNSLIMKSSLQLLALAFALLALSASPSHGEPGAGRLAALRESYERAVEKATAPLRDTYRKELLKLQTEFTEAGDLDAALAVERELKTAFPSEAKMPKVSALAPEPVLAKVTVEGFPTADLKKGVPLYGDADYVWVDIPDAYQAIRFAQPVSKHTGTTKFRVESDGMVYVAFYSRWTEEPSGNEDGILSRKEIEKLRWREVREEHYLKSNESPAEWIVCARECKAGEELTLRTDKYCAPIVLMK